MNDFTGKTVLVTGATGLIGSNLVEALLRKGDCAVIALSRSREKLEHIFREHLANPDFEIIAQDICSPIVVPEGTSIDCIFHAAGPISGSLIASQPADVILPNVIGTKNCLDFAKSQRERYKASVRVVVFSSATVYVNDSGEDRSFSESETENGTAVDAPNAPYAESKRMAEILATAYHKQFSVDAVIARIGYVYGYCQTAPETAFYDFLRTALSGQDIHIKNPSMARRDNIYIDDAVRGLIAVCEKGESGQAYNISSGGENKNFAAADEMAAVIASVVNRIQSQDNHPVQVQYDAPPVPRIPGVILDNQKLKCLGWLPEVGLEEGIQRTVEAAMRRDPGCGWNR